MADRLRGVVKFFKDDAGYGFIKPETGDDVFVHIHDLRQSKIDDLGEGDRVSFETAPGRKGLKAVNVMIEG